MYTYTHICNPVRSDLCKVSKFRTAYWTRNLFWRSELKGRRPYNIYDCVITEKRRVKTNKQKGKAGIQPNYITPLP